jgi:hypothetical protein
MRQKARLYLHVSILLLFVRTSAVAQGNRLDTIMDCGTVVEDIALCLSPSAKTGSVTLEVRNTGPKDMVLNLGIMLGNGARQYPSAIRLRLTDAKGNVHQGVLAEPGIVAGRLDPFIVPLPHGASLILPLDLTKYVLYTSGQIEEFRPNPTTPYTVQAQFTGQGVTQAEANLDVRGLALMPYWTGIAASNTVATMKK